MPISIKSNPPFSAEVLQASSARSATSAAALNAATAANAASAASAISLPAATAATSAASRSINPASLFLAASAIDVGTNPPPPTIIRNGVEIRPPSFNLVQVGDLINHSTPILRPQVQVVISQSLPAGTRVAKGTPIDLVLTPVNSIPLNVFTQFHADLATHSVADLLPIVTDPQVAPILAKDPATLTDNDKGVITAKLANQGVTVSTTDTSRSFNLAFQSLLNAQAFQ